MQFLSEESGVTLSIAGDGRRMGRRKGPTGAQQGCIFSSTMPVAPSTLLNTAALVQTSVNVEGLPIGSHTPAGWLLTHEGNWSLFV